MCNGRGAVTVQDMEAEGKPSRVIYQQDNVEPHIALGHRYNFELKALGDGNGLLFFDNETGTARLITK